MVLDLGADHGRNEDRQRLEELVDAEWSGLRYELKTKQAVDKAVNASILHSPSHRQDDAKVECEVVEGCVEDQNYATDHCSDHINHDCPCTRNAK